jgi:DNA-binding response OmpR family regulator
MKILLAEDDHHVSVIMQICLQKLGGHDVIVVDDGEKALSVAQTAKFDLILLDGMMPKKTGLVVAEELKARGDQTPVIFLTAKSDEPRYQTFGKGYIAKPFEPTQICQRIDEILKGAA